MSMSLYVAMVLGVVVLVASMVSVELGLSIAVIEIVLGVAAGNLLHLQAPEWLGFLASFGSIVLTFLAGAEGEGSHPRRTANRPLGLMAPGECAGSFLHVGAFFMSEEGPTTT